MTLTLTSKTGKDERKWTKLCFLVCMCAVATGFLFVPLRNGQTIVHFLTGAVWGLAIEQAFTVLFKSP
jgi:cyanate permease